MADDTISTAVENRYDADVIWKMTAITDNMWYLGQAKLAPGDYRLLYELNGDENRAGFRNIMSYPGLCLPQGIYFSLFIVIAILNPRLICNFELNTFYKHPTFVKYGELCLIPKGKIQH